MRKLEKPIDDAIDVFNLCISKVANKGLKKKLEDCEVLITSAVKEYELKAPNTQLHTIVPNEEVNGEKFMGVEMKKVYTGKMVGLESPGRDFYDKLLSSAPNDICPLCAQRIVDSLDHHLPKEHFPIYSVVPINIFPCCLPCNKSKLSFFPKSENEEPIHPYYDNVVDDLWLQAKIIESNPPSLKYFTMKPDNWSEIKYQRIENHFGLLKLERLYASQSGVEFAQINYRVSELFRTGGKDSVKGYLSDSYKSSNCANVNSWQTAFYFALLNSEWYQDGGFKE